MPRAAAPLTAFNRGEVSPLALGRVDVEKLRLAAEEMENWVPTVLGPMQLRPGSAFVGGIANDAPSITLPFVYSVADTALIEMTPNALRVLVDEVPIARWAVATTFAPGAMASAAGWTTANTPGASAAIGSGQMVLVNDAQGGIVTSYASMAVSSPGAEHALRIAVSVGPVTLRVGSAVHGVDLIKATTLLPGVHSLAFTPAAGTVYVEFELAGIGRATVGGATLEGAGVLSLPTPWAAAALPLVRWDQSADVLFLACAGLMPRRIERRGPRSWSVAAFRPNDGPFLPPDPRGTLSVANSGSLTAITASRAVFQPGDVGRLLRVFTPNFGFLTLLDAADAVSPAIRVAGVGSQRAFTFAVAGTFSGSWVLESSVTGETTGFTTQGDPNSTPPGALLSGSGPYGPRVLSDTRDNVVVWYRIRATSLTSGEIQVTLNYQGGGATGVYRIQQVDSPSQVQALMLKPASSAAAATVWSLGEWADSAVWPTAVALYDGRLGFSGGDRVWLSVSDAFGSFADTLADGVTVGDASAIARSIGYGPVAIINWLLPLSRLIIGTLGSEVSVRSSALDAPLTPTGGLTLKDCSTLGSLPVPAAKCDTRGLFVQRSGQRLVMLAYDVNSQDYGAADLNRLHPDLCLGNPIVRIAVQRQPNTRVHCIRQDGTAAVLVLEPADEIQAWYRVTMPGGVIEDVAVLPGSAEDRVYYTVRRGAKRTRERFARLDEARGGALSKCADAHVVYQGPATATIGGLAHLEGQQVVVYADGQDRGVFAVSGGAITLPTPVANACVGLGYAARFRSAKLAYGGDGTALNRKKRLERLGLLLANTHRQGIRFGGDYVTMDTLPLIEDGAPIDASGGWASYDEPDVTVPGIFDTDARLCITAQAPRPATVVAASIVVATDA